MGKFPEIFTDFEMCASIPWTTGSIALFVGDDDVIYVNTYMGDDGGEYAFVEQWIRDNGRHYDYGCAVRADDANGAVVKVLRAANSFLGYRFVADMPELEWDRMVAADRALDDARQAAVDAGRDRARVMAALVERGATQSEIARRLGITPSSVSIALKSLEIGN